MAPTEKMEVDRVATNSAAVPADTPIPTGPSKDRQFARLNIFKHLRKNKNSGSTVNVDRREKKQSIRHLRRNAISGPSTGPRPISGTDWYDVPSSMLTAQDKLLIATNRIPMIVHVVFKTGFSFSKFAFMEEEATIDICRYLELEGKLSSFQGDGNRIADFMRMVLNECERFKYGYADNTLFKEMPKRRGVMRGFWTNIAAEVSIKQTIAKGQPAETWADDMVKWTTIEEILGAFIDARKSYLDEMAKDGGGDTNGGAGGAGSGASVQEAPYTKKIVGLIKAIDNWIAFSEAYRAKCEAKELALAIDHFQM
ncbi:hypothetical protein CSAL01_01322 [Colletotrichum salicis]|uniref:Uncharacterized protein n=1 Tax=Colletotrichum salicis TaxID=1209931 RepID=A0A135UUJ6_9PEZI|nr:hypothetical protein CSAL01_01322 [Colletotrichum salicis]